jgi:hypothetical protein
MRFPGLLASNGNLAQKVRPTLPTLSFLHVGADGCAGAQKLVSQTPAHAWSVIQRLAKFHDSPRKLKSPRRQILLRMFFFTIHSSLFPISVFTIHYSKFTIRF